MTSYLCYCCIWQHTTLTFSEFTRRKKSEQTDPSRMNVGHVRTQDINWTNKSVERLTDESVFVGIYLSRFLSFYLIQAYTHTSAGSFVCKCKMWISDVLVLFAFFWNKRTRNRMGSIVCAMCTIAIQRIITLPTSCAYHICTHSMHRVCLVRVFWNDTKNQCVNIMHVFACNCRRTMCAMLKYCLQKKKMQRVSVQLWFLINITFAVG